MRNYILKADGTIVEYKHTLKGKAGDLENAQAAVGGLIQMVDIFPPKATKPSMILVCDEEGLLKSKPINSGATKIFQSCYRTQDVIVGDVIIMHPDDVK